MGLWIVGIGPGKPEGMTGEAVSVLENCEVIAGYTVYTDLVKDRFPDKEYYNTPMRQETERCRWALAQAALGRETALVCSGDAGIYGMAGLVCELLPETEEAPEVRIIPGVTAATGGAAVLGAPLAHDFAVISLSDLLTDMEDIKKRLRCAAMGDMVVCLYNPSSKKRADHLRMACDIILAYRSPETVCGYVKNIGREGESAAVLTLGELRTCRVDMFTTVYIGNSSTVRIGDRMVTPRGYRIGTRTMAIRESGGGRGDGERDQADGSVRRAVIFGGTTEGRLLYEYCVERRIPVSVYVATEYGAQVLRPRREDGTEDVQNLQAVIHTGRLTMDEMQEAVGRERAVLVMDATHPFAVEATANIRAACRALAVPCYRIRRKLSEDEAPEGIYFDSIDDAVSYLEGKEGNILATTGSRDLIRYTALTDYRERLYVRVLPEIQAIAACMDMGISGRHLAAMQGPFTEEMNYGFIKEFDIRWVVTKQSGRSGGFTAKRDAAGRAGATLLIIRKNEESGISLEEATEILEVLTHE